MGMNVLDRNAGFAAGQEQVWGFDKSTGIDEKSYLAPGAKIFYVDPNNAQATDAGNLGEDPTVPLFTIQYAVTNLVRDHMGDTIVVGANDAWQYAPGVRPLPIRESVIVPPTKGGFKIVGASTNPFGVQWEAGDDDEACLTIRGIDVLVEGFLFVEDTFDDTTGVLLEWTGTTGYGENATIRNCAFYQLDYGIVMDYAWFNQIYHNYFLGCVVAAVHNSSVAGDADYNFIHDNTFDGNTVALDLDTSDNNSIYKNRITVPDPAALTAVAIDLDGNDNQVSNNYLSCTTAQADVIAPKGANDFWVFNHCTDGEH